MTPLVQGVGRSLLAAVVATAVSAPLAAETPLAVHIHSEKAMFQVLISPGRAGSENFVLQLMNGDGTLLAVKAAKLVLRKQDGGTEPVAREANLGHDGYWHVENVPIRPAGRWHMWIEAQTMFQRITLEDDFDLPEQ